MSVTPTPRHYMRCSVMQCAAVCCNTCCNTLQCVAVCCSMLQYAAWCCGVLQSAAGCSNIHTPIYNMHLSAAAAFFAATNRICAAPIKRSCGATFLWSSFCTDFPSCIMYAHMFMYQICACKYVCTHVYVPDVCM